MKCYVSRERKAKRKIEEFWSSGLATMEVAVKATGGDRVTTDGKNRFPKRWRFLWWWCLGNSDDEAAIVSAMAAEELRLTMKRTKPGCPMAIEMSIGSAR